MAVPFLLIDGYNVMHAAGLARASYGPGDLERCRHRLLRLLIGLLNDEELSRAKVVFDAFDAPVDLPRKSRFEGLQVVFAESGSDADSLIEEMIARHSAPRQILVVSGDRRLRKAARRRRAKSVESYTFLEQMLHRPDTKREPVNREPNPKFDVEISPGELEEWSELFQEVEELIEADERQREREEEKRRLKREQEARQEEEEEDWDPEGEWDELYRELGLAGELALEMEDDKRERNKLDRLQEEINQIIEKEDF